MVMLRDGIERSESARSKTFPLNMPLRGPLELADDGTVACAAGPRAALSGVAGSGLTYGLTFEPEW